MSNFWGALHNRWFLFGLNADKNKITNYPLDRILNIAILDTAYIEKDEDLDMEEYFDEIIGVTFPKEEEKRKVANIVLKFHKDLYPYIKSKPIHQTQHCYDDEYKVTFQVIPNIELRSLILSYGSQVEVIEPQSLRDEIKEHALKMKEIYN